jgi:hypothetical protein
MGHKWKFVCSITFCSLFYKFAFEIGALVVPCEFLVTFCVGGVSVLIALHVLSVAGEVMLV